MNNFSEIGMLCYCVVGVLDDATIAQMNKPRCGDKDFYPAGTTRVKRYILLRMRWQRGRQIDIQFRNHTPDMSVDEQEAIMKDVVDVSVIYIYMYIYIIPILVC